jgi:hypothetical protein
MLLRSMAVTGIAVMLAVWAASPLYAQAPPLDAKTGGAIVGDMTLDQIYLTFDVNGDGDADDEGEAWVFFDETNASGLPAPTAAVYAVFQSVSGYVFYGDGTADAIYRIIDLNGDGDAQDVGEANVWFSAADNFHGFLLPSPQGLFQDTTGATYILNAGTLETGADALYRTVDLNGDGDANDENEATLWMDIEGLAGDQAPFQLSMMGDVAYFGDTKDADEIYRAEDANANGVIEATEWNIFIDEYNAYGVEVGATVVNDGTSLYVMEELSTHDQKVFRLTDLNASNDIDDASEVVEVWNEGRIPPEVEMGSCWALAIGPGGELLVASSGADEKDNIFRLIDVNDDGDFLDDNETILYAKGNGSDVFVDYARSLDYALPPVCPGDVDGDGDTDQSDLGGLLAAWCTHEGDPDWNPDADLDGDGHVGQGDLGTLLANWNCFVYPP